MSKSTEEQLKKKIRGTKDVIKTVEIGSEYISLCPTGMTGFSKVTSEYIKQHYTLGEVIFE